MNDVKNKETIHLKSSRKSKIRIEALMLTAAEADYACVSFSVRLQSTDGGGGGQRGEVVDRVQPPVWESGGLGPETPLPSP